MYHLKPGDDSVRANLYKANYLLRKLGIRPTPPGQSAWRDAVKRAAMGGALQARNLARTVTRRRPA